MKKIVTVTLSVAAAVLFLSPWSARAAETFYWSSNLAATSTQSLFIGYQGQSSLVLSLFNFNFWAGPLGFTDANFVDLKLTTNGGVSNLTEPVVLTICTVIQSLGSGAYNCTGSSVIATSTPFTAQSIGQTATSSWQRIYFSTTWNAPAGSTMYAVLRPVNAAVAPSLYMRYDATGEIDRTLVYAAASEYNHIPLRLGYADPVLPSVYVNYPVSGYYGAPNFPSWGVHLDPTTIASTTLQVYVDYSNLSTEWLHTDQTTILSSVPNGNYSVSRDQNVDLSLGSGGIVPKTWYVRARVYNDCLGDGTYACLVSTSPTVSFVYYPGSVIYTATTTPSGQMFTYSSTSTCPQGIVCTGTSGTQFYVDQNGVVQVVSSTTVAVDQSAFAKFYSLWKPLQYKAPWGYATLVSDLLRDMGSSTATSTSWAYTTSTPTWISMPGQVFLGVGKVLEPALAVGRTITGGAVYVGALYVAVKMLAIML